MLIRSLLFLLADTSWVGFQGDQPMVADDSSSMSSVKLGSMGVINHAAVVAVTSSGADSRRSAAKRSRRRACLVFQSVSFGCQILREGRVGYWNLQHSPDRSIKS